MTDPATVPAWHEFMAPVLRVQLDGEARRRRVVYELVADAEGLTPEQRALTLASGPVMYSNRISWAMSYLTRAGALESPSRAMFAITDVGRALLEDHPEGITLKHLRGMLPVTAPCAAGESADSAGGSARDLMDDLPEIDPTEQVTQGIKRIHADVGADLLARLRAMDPADFESAVVTLLVAMGYGGADGKAQVTGRSGDGGIDGIIDQDVLGLDQVYVQAKRYADGNTVGREAIQAFIGALHGVGATRGVFLTSSSFTRGADEYARSIATRVVLIDGVRLADLMIKYRVGVQVKETYHVVEVDEDFFE